MVLKDMINLIMDKFSKNERPSGKYLKRTFIHVLTFTAITIVWTAIANPTNPYRDLIGIISKFFG